MTTARVHDVPTAGVRRRLLALFHLHPQRGGRCASIAYAEDRVLTAQILDDGVSGRDTDHLLWIVQAAWAADEGQATRQPHPAMAGLWVYDGALLTRPDGLEVLAAGTWRRPTWGEVVWLEAGRALWPLPPGIAPGGVP